MAFHPQWSGFATAFTSICLLAACGRQTPSSRTDFDDSSLPQVVESTSDASFIYFFSPGCPDCAELERTYLPALEAVGIPIDKVNVEEPAGFDQVYRLHQAHGAGAASLAPTAYYDRQLAVGLTAVREIVGAAVGRRMKG